MHDTPPARPLRLLAVSSAIDPRYGGPPATSRDMWTAARREGIALSLAVCVSNPPTAAENEAIEELRRQGIEVRPFRFSRLLPRLSPRWGVSLALAPWVMRAAAASDVVQVHGAYVFSTLAGAVAARLHRRPLVVIPHETLTDFDVRENPSRWRRGLKRIVKRWLLDAAAAVVFSSQLERRDSIGGRQTGTSFVIYHPAFDERQPRCAPRQGPQGPAELRLRYLGRFAAKKNLELLIEAVAGSPGTRLTIAGDGPAEYRARLVDLARRRGVAHRVEWLGFIPGSQKAAFFAAIDVLAMPSRYECFGRSAAEALVHGVPAIVSERTGIAEIVARHGCGLVAAPDAAALRAAIGGLAAEPGRLRELSQRAVAARESELSLGAWGAAMTPIYRRLSRLCAEAGAGARS